MVGGLLLTSELCDAIAEGMLELELPEAVDEAGNVEFEYIGAPELTALRPITEF